MKHAHSLSDYAARFLRSIRNVLVPKAGATTPPRSLWGFGHGGYGLPSLIASPSALDAWGDNA